MNVLPLICLILFATAAVNAQQPKPLIPKTVERSGWTALVFADQVSEVESREPVGVEGVEVQVKLHKLSKEQLVFAESCNPKVDKRLKARGYGNAFLVRDFMSYQVGERVYAYGVSYYIITAKSGVIIERYGAAVTYHYVDLDGDGKFQIYCGAKPLRYLPQWVKALASTGWETSYRRGAV